MKQYFVSYETYTKPDNFQCVDKQIFIRYNFNSIWSNVLISLGIPEDQY